MLSVRPELIQILGHSVASTKITNVKRPKGRSSIPVSRIRKAIDALKVEVDTLEDMDILIQSLAMVIRRLLYRSRDLPDPDGYHNMVWAMLKGHGLQGNILRRLK